MSATPSLSEHDLATVRQLYGEAQNWTRHYEQLIVNANVLIVSACLIFVGLAFGDKVTTGQSLALMLIPMGMALIGMVLTHTLFRLYAACIERMIRMERLLGCFDAARFNPVDGQGSLLPGAMQSLPVQQPTSVRFFHAMQGLLILAYAGMAWSRWP